MRRTILDMKILLLLLLLSPLAATPDAEAAGTMKDYCITPPFVSDTAPPLVMVLMAKDHKQFYKAYNDLLDLDGDGTIENTYNDSVGFDAVTQTGGYYGYFDPNKCYVYNAGSDRFDPNSMATGAYMHFCSGASEWSGNFLNWAAMSRMDIMRKVLYGGTRGTNEDSGTMTVLHRAIIPNDAHSWAKAYNGADLSNLIPFKTWTGITLCNQNTGESGTDAISSKIYMIKGYYPYAASTDGKQCQYTHQGGAALVNDGEGATPTVDAHYSWYYANVRVCLPDSDRGSLSLEPNCVSYSQGTSALSYKPSGLLQKYGVNRHETSEIADDTAQILFGLMTGSFSETSNDKGGVLRANIKDLTTAYGNANGSLANNVAANLIKSMDLFKVVGNSYSGDYANVSAWENPMGEMYYEALRYYMGKATPTTNFTPSQFDRNLNSMPTESWENPWTTKPRCSKPFVLMLSDLSPSFDSNELPGSYWSTAVSPNDTGLNVQTLITNSGMNTIENIGQVFIGQYQSTTDRDCTPKPGAGSANYGQIRGLCIDEPTREGSYYIDGLAHWAHTHDVSATATGDQKITTYTVATAAPVPELEFNAGGSSVTMLPIFHDGCPFNNTTKIPYCDSQGKGGDNSKGQIVDFKLLMTPTVSCIAGDTDCNNERTLNGYQYGYQVMWDDCEAGCDHDLDMSYRIYVKTSGTTITVKTKGVYAAAGNSGFAGYIINGVGSASSGQYYEVICGGDGIAGYNDCDAYNTLTNDTGFGDGMGNAVVERSFTATGTSGAQLLKSPLWYAAKYGAFNDRNGSNTPDQQREWDSDLDGEPDTYFYAANPLRLESELEKALTDILKKASSGTAASVLASGEGSGANLIQAVFYPKRSFFDDNEILWSGVLQNLWYYIDPRTTNSTIRENTADAVSGIMDLKLDSDRIVQFFFDTGSQKTKARLYSDTNADGIKDDVNSDSVIDELDAVATVNLENMNYLWEAGQVLWARDLSASPRTIYTPVDATDPKDLSRAENRFSRTTSAQIDRLRPYLNTDVTGRTAAQNQAVAGNIIRWTQGEHVPTYTDAVATERYRSRRVSIDLNDDGVIDASTENHVWKLGDIINSTPKIMSWIPLNLYDKAYNDTTYKSYIASSQYKTRGLVFSGANDGMLHAFKLGFLQIKNDATTIKAKLCDDANGNGDCEAGETTPSLGWEEWAFIPRNVLPYLKYIKENDYCHIYSVDLTPFIFDASIGIDSDTNDDGTNDQPAECTDAEYWRCNKSKDSWRTVLIGGMRLGGACKNACPNPSTDPNCVQTPATDKGYSSYFALDVTDPAAPKLLWEYAHADLGYATSGPGVVKINARVVDPGDPSRSNADKSRNGRWFVVFASGPTGPINTTTHQFGGHSTQNLKLFVLDLKTGALATTSPIDTGITNAFGSSLVGGSIDYDKDYQDDALYFGYTKPTSLTPNKSTDPWIGGGIIRLITREDLSSGSIGAAGTTALNANNWLWTEMVQNTGAVNSAVAHLAHYASGSTSPDKAWIFFGSGRYFFKTAAGVDDQSTQRSLFAVYERCLPKIKNITSTTSAVCDNTDMVTKADLGAAATAAGSTDVDGWYIDLDGTSGTTYNERVITDPLATETGVVYFTSFAPTADVCEYGGKSYLWAVKYDTGGAVGGLKGKGLIQVSTGEIKEVNLGTGLTEREGRRTSSMDGVPPTGQGLSVVVPPKPTDRIMHIRKR